MTLPGRLVQPVNVLGDYRFQLARPLQLGQLAVGGVGLCIRTHQLVPVKLIELLRMGHKKAVAKHGLRRIVILLVVQAVHTAKIRDSRLRAHPRAAKKHDIVALLNPLLPIAPVPSWASLLTSSILPRYRSAVNREKPPDINGRLFPDRSIFL